MSVFPFPSIVPHHEHIVDALEIKLAIPYYTAGGTHDTIWVQSVPRGVPLNLLI